MAAAGGCPLVYLVLGAGLVYFAEVLQDKMLHFIDTMCVQCEDCKFASWDFEFFRDGNEHYEVEHYVPPYNEQFDFYCSKHERFYMEQDITGMCTDGIAGDNNYSEVCNEYYKEKELYLRNT